MFENRNATMLYAPEKNNLLQLQRGINFEDIKQAFAAGNFLFIEEHPNQEKYPNQKLMNIEVNDYFYVVPYVKVDENTLFLKTVYPSRKAKKFHGKKQEIL